MPFLPPACLDVLRRHYENRQIRRRAIRLMPAHTLTCAIDIDYLRHVATLRRY